ncbi:MAG TPA: FtsX-like permease family protein, partial [Candidatus Lokiarchaeia archaeon]|nr:FtsX-like permease family protein [Candidatus Lokiarchaeia archaeon]
NTIIGLVGGLFGYIAGFGTCFLFLQAELGNQFPAFLSMGLVHGDWMSLLFALLLGAGICVVAVLSPILRLKKIAVVDETKKYINSQTSKSWKSRLDITALISGATPIAWTLIFSQQVVQSLPGDYQSIFLVIGQVMTGASLLAPFLLTYGIIKLIAGRSPTRFAKFSHMVAKLFSRKSADLIGRNVGGRPKQSGGLVFILAITISMGLLMEITKASEAAYENNLAYGLVGADIQVWSPTSPGNVSFAFKDALAKFSPDIAEVTSAFFSLDTEARGTPINPGTQSTLTTPIEVCGINTSDYCNAVNFDPSLVPTGNPNATFAQLASVPNGTLLLQSWAKANGYRVGDPFIVKYYTSASTTFALSFVVAGYIYALPGFLVSNFPVMATNLQYLEQQNFTNQVQWGYPIYFVKMVDHPTVNSSTLADDIYQQFPTNVLGINTLENAQKYAGYDINVVPNVSIVSLTSVLDVEYTFIVIMATAGVGIIIYRSFSDRRREIAELRAKGMRFSDLLKLQGGEGTTLVIIGGILGSIGILVAYTLNLQIATNLSLWFSIPRPFVIPLSLLWQMGLTLGILVALVWIISWREVKHTEIPEIAEVLRIY